jgi:hypothetical protein
MHPDDVEKQTITTIENISELYSRENQDEFGIHFDMSQVAIEGILP